MKSVYLCTGNTNRSEGGQEPGHIGGPQALGPNPLPADNKLAHAATKPPMNVGHSLRHRRAYVRTLHEVDLQAYLP